MSTTIDQKSRPSVRLESWRESIESKELTTFSDKVELWTVAVMRNEIDGNSINFVIKIALSGTEQFDWLIPSTAHVDIAEVFLHGGSFLKATMPHMENEWNSVSASHPNLYSIFVQEILRQVVSPENGAEPVARRWTRL